MTDEEFKEYIESGVKEESSTDFLGSVNDPGKNGKKYASFFRLMAKKLETELKSINQDDKAQPSGVLPLFETLWTNYPHDIDGEHQHPSSDSYAYNQCAIRLGYSLQLSGVDMSNYNKGPVTSEGYPRGAKSLADWLLQEYSRPTIVSPQEFEQNYLNNTQGIFYQHTDPGGVGHIDLYKNGDTGSGYYSGYKEIWFWILK